MISSQCTRRQTAVSSFVFVIMIGVKFLLLFSPLLLLANAQSGGRLGFFSRPDFRRPRPWERPTVAPVPDTPMPTEKVTEHLYASADSSRARTELPTITPVRPTSGTPVSSVPSFSQRGRIWARPVFQGSRPIAISTPETITPTESITIKVEEYSPAVSTVSSTTEPEVYVITPSNRVPFVDNHAQYKDPNNFNSRGEYTPKITHNNDEIPSDSTKTTMKSPLTTEKITEIITEQPTRPAENYSSIVSSTSTTESVRYTMAPTTAVPFINNHVTELRTTPEPLITTRATNSNSRTPLPPYISNNNVPTPGIQPQYIPGDFLKPSPTTIAATTEIPSSTTESAGYKIASSTKVPFVDEHQRYDDIYLTTKTPIPIKIVSITGVASATTSHPIYQVNQNDKNNIASDSEIHLTTVPKAVTMPTTEPEEYIITPKTKAPFIDEHKENDNDFTSHLSVEYANGYEKSSEEQSNSDGYNAPIYPVYHHETEKVSHYEQSSLSTRKPEGYTVATAKVPFIDLHKLHDVGFTSGPAVEYTNGHDKTTEIPTSKIPTDDSQEFIHKIYQNNNFKGNDYEQSSTPKVVTTTQSAYQYRPPKTTTDQAVTQTVRYTNSYRYTDMTTKPTTRYTTTVRPSRANNVYDIDNFKCKDHDAYYSISNQCDDFIECKSGYPIQNTCPDGLHFNRAAKYGEFPCAFPSEVKCDSNSVIRQPEPTSSCPRRYGYFSMQDGRCDKYIMCQEGQATIMSCPAGLAFSVATSSCDWPSNVPDCLPDVFQGFTCPAPELNEDGEPTHSILKYRYDKSCKKYIACQKGHPRLLSCDSGLAFDEYSESCVDELDVTNCT